jgi:hypothetical protein
VVSLYGDAQARRPGRKRKADRTPVARRDRRPKSRLGGGSRGRSDACALGHGFLGFVLRPASLVHSGFGVPARRRPCADRRGVVAEEKRTGRKTLYPLSGPFRARSEMVLNSGISGDRSRHQLFLKNSYAERTAEMAHVWCNYRSGFLTAINSFVSSVRC